MLKAVIFDVDGTLAETEEVHREAFNTVFEQVGLGWFWSSEEYCELLKVFGGKERIRHFVETESIDGISDEDILELHRLKTSLYAELLPRTASFVLVWSASFKNACRGLFGWRLPLRQQNQMSLR